jgi:hypothetical protein
MIINETVSSPVISNVLAAPSRFKIKASAKAFKILSGFYSEPILAIPRELGANAWDSHVKAGNTNKMFEVHAPNTLEPWFAIRDFGTGLSPEAIDTIYTTYFESTKTSDNDSDGCMGLGSKTPFNYTENFNVTSFYNGKKYVYNCFIDEQGSPNIMQVAVTDTVEPNGVEVKFGVKIADISMWVDKISRAYEPFRNRPIIKGANIEFKPRDYIYQGNNWSIRKNQNEHYSRGSNAFMGNYCYPINADAVRRTIYNIEKDNAYKLEQALNYGNFDLFFNIGDLDVAPNKEQLQYEENNSTCIAIINALKTAIVELKNQVTNNIEVPKSLWDAMYLYNKYNGYNSPYSNVRNIIGGEIPINLNGKKIEQGNENVVSAHRNAGCISPNGTIGDIFTVYNLDTINGRVKRTGTYHPHSDTRGVHIFYTNGTSIKNARLRHHLRTKYANSKLPTCFIIADNSKNLEIFNKHKAYFGWDDNVVTHIDSLPKPPPVPRAKKTANTDEIPVADISNFYKQEYAHRNLIVGFNKAAAEFDSNGTYYYVNFSYSDAVYGNEDKKIDDILHHAVHILVDNKSFTEKTIYGINKKNSKLLKIGKWVNVIDLAKNVVAANKSKYEQDMYDHTQLPEYRECGSMFARLNNSRNIIANINNIQTRTMLEKFVASHKVLNHKKYDHIPLLTLLGFTAKNHSSDTFDISSFKKIFENKYLDIFSSVTGYDDHSKLIYTFINLVDEKA